MRRRAQISAILGMSIFLAGCGIGLFPKSYAAGSWQDKLVVAFEGTHDVFGGQATGLYDSQGNTKRSMSETERFIRDRMSEMALVPSAPFAAATLLPPEIWNAISIFLKAAK